MLKPGVERAWRAKARLAQQKVSSPEKGVTTTPDPFDTAARGAGVLRRYAPPMLIAPSRPVLRKSFLKTPVSAFILTVYSLGPRKQYETS